MAPQLRPAILAIAGPMGSGKSTLSRELAVRLQWPRASFGEFLWNEVSKRIPIPSRSDLQEEGSHRIRIGPIQFCRDVLESASWKEGRPAIVDGVRHVRILEALKSLSSPLQTVLVYLDISRTEQLQRLAHREDLTPEQIAILEVHPTEVEVAAKLKALAEVSLDGATQFTELVDLLFVRIRAIQESRAN